MIKIMGQKFLKKIHNNSSNNYIKIKNNKNKNKKNMMIKILMKF